MGFKKDNFSMGEMGDIVGQNGRVIGSAVCFSERFPFIENPIRYIRLLIVFLVMFAGHSAFGQTPGLILKPATGTGAAVMDPDGDGYVSQKTAGQQLGFQNNDVAESEIPFVAIVRPDPLGDILRGPVGGFTEIVGTDAAGNNAILTYTDGINLYFRFRLSGFAPNSKSYSLLVDTDQRFGFSGTNADPDAIAGNAGFEVEIVLRTNFTVDIYNVNGTTNGTRVATYSYDTNCQKSIALSAAGGTPDYFYDFYVPYPSLFTSSTALRYVASTGMSPSPAMGSTSASDVGGATQSGVSLDQLFTDLINVQTPTVPGQEVLDRTNCPAITGPIASGANSVSGTSGDIGATIRLYVNDVQVGTATVNGGSWTFTELAPMEGGTAVKATAQAIGKGESSSSCNLTFVGSSCSITPLAVGIENGNKGGRVTNAKSYPVGTVFTLYYSSTNMEWSAPGDNNPYTLTLDDINLEYRTVDIDCGGNGNCLNAGSYYIVAKAPGQCESQKGFFCIDGSGSTSLTPSIDNTILPLSSYVTGTNGVAGAVLYVYANGVQIGSKLLSTNGAWSVQVPSSSLCNTSLTAQQIASSQCISAISTAVAIGSAVTSAPTISINKCSAPVTSVTGFSGESDGTTIQLYVNGVQRAGTATVSGGSWTFTTTAITTNQTITARATNSLACKTQSELSAPVTLSGTTTLTGSYSIPSAIAEGASSVSVVVSGVSGTYILNLYIDGDKIGSKSFTGNGTVVIPVTYTSDIYTGGNLQVSLTEGNKCESNLSGILKTVECNTPSFATSVISTPSNNKCVTTSGLIDITNSQTGVIYTPVDGSGNVKGYSMLGTGGTITLTTHAFPASGGATFFVKAQRIVASGTCDATSTTSISFNAFAPPQFTVHPASKIVCSGESTTLTASWTGIGPYNVQWQVNNGSGFVNLSNGGIYSQTSATGITSTTATLSISNVSGLDNYTFRCIVTDTEVPTDCQSSTSNTSTLSVPIVTISNALVTNATSGNNGSVDITASGGTGPYTYDWHHLNGPGTFGELEDLTGLSEGTYTVTAKDVNGCTYQQTFMVGGVSSINLSLNNKTDVTCYGLNNGSFTVSASSGTEPYSYSIDNFATLPQTSGGFSGLKPGSYIVRARDAALKPSNTVLVIVTEPMEMVVSAVISNPSVLLNDGSIHFTLEGGTPNFSYSLYKVGTPNVLIPGNTDTGRTITYSNLSAGIYFIEVTDANGCTAGKSNIVLTAPVVQSVQCTHTALHTFNDNSISGYDGDFNYFASNWTESPLGNEIAISGDALAFGNIPSSQNNTISLNTLSSIYREIDLQGASNIVLSYTLALDGPNNQNNFTVQLYVNDVLQATYNPNSLPTSPIKLSGVSFKTISGNSLNKIEFRISAGSARANLRIDDFTLTFTKSLSVGVVTLPATCNNGKIDLSISGGYPPYFVDWDNDGTGDFNDLEDLTGLAPGTYKVTVKDSRNCTTTPPVVAVIGSAPLAASVSGSVNPTCVGGGSNGSITATLSSTGNGGPYIYQLYKGASELVSSVYSAAATKTFTGLTAGAYYVKAIQSADNCSVQTAPVTLTMPVLTSTITVVGEKTICSGSSTSIKVDITGGTSPYTVELSNGQSVTNYTSGAPIVVTPVVSTTLTVVSVTDASSCVSSSNTGYVDILVNPSEGSWTGAIDQDWNNPGNWVCNHIPTLETNVLIANDKSHYPILSSGASGKAYHITIESDASVTVTGNTLQIAGDISNTGTFTATEGTIEMKGSLAQSISANVFSTNTLMNLMINNAAGVTLGGALNITGVVSPVMGNFNANGHLTLLSTESQTALIDGAGAGNVLGNVNIQRYLTNSFGYKYFSSPFQGATVAELADEVNLTESFPTFYKYDENHSRDSVVVTGQNTVIYTVYYSGWTKYIETTNALDPMAGYAANMGTGTDAVTVTMSGLVNNGTLGTTLFNRNRKYTKGFNLVGNPYPSPIDWNAIGWTKTNIDNAIYFFNAGNTDRYTGVYSSYVNGVSTGNANNVIAAMQGFFVHVTNGTFPVQGTLGVSNAVRINNLTPVFKSAMIDNRPLLRLTANFEIKKAIEDVAVVYFDHTAGSHFEKEKDALKLDNTDELVPNIYTLTEGNKLSINGLSEPSDSVFYIPVGITTYRDGWINMRAENARDLPYLQVYLSDATTGNYHDLRYSSEARFLLQRGVHDNRFRLVFSKAPFTGEYPGAEKLFKLIRTENQVLVKVNLPVGTKGNLMVNNVMGQSILRKEVSGKETVSISHKSVTGVYVITLVSGRRTESEKILMRQDYE